jgi:uncharacterized iron-regulated protein
VSRPPGTVLSGGRVTTAEAMLAALDGADVVFVGEKHDDPLAHEWELFIWRSLASPDRSLALEMFETDVQDLLDGYLAGEISREFFLMGARPWPNYEEAYAPLVELAAERGLRVTAANVPRPLAAAVARGGWEALEGHDLSASLAVDASNAAYRERFLATVGSPGEGMHAMRLDPMNLYRAQLLKDAVMAASVAGLRCVLVCGCFHSDFRSGIPDQLPAGTTYLTVKVIPEGERPDPSAADFLITR